MDRREMLHTTALGVAGFAVGTGFTAPGCPDKKDVSPYVVTVIGALEELKPLLPAQESIIVKAISTAKRFNEVYQNGNFEDAGLSFENLTSTVNELITVAGINVSQSVKVAIAIAGVGLRAIAVMLRQHTQDPAVAKAVSAKAASSEAVAKQKTLVEKMADPKAIDALYAAAKP